MTCVGLFCHDRAGGSYITDDVEVGSLGPIDYILVSALRREIRMNLYPLQLALNDRCLEVATKRFRPGNHPFPALLAVQLDKCVNAGWAQSNYFGGCFQFVLAEPVPLH